MECDLARLLVVDDDEANRELLYDLLTPRGYSVTLAEDGEQALRLIDAEDFDLVLLDITMPGMDGFEVLAEIRCNQGRSALPVIMVTGLNERELVVRALEGGANDYVTKPLELPVIVARLRTHLSLKHAYDQIVALEHNLELRNEELEQTNDKLQKALGQLQGDMQSAAKVQRALLPSTMPDVPGVRFTWAFHPCADLAGDCLNVFQLDEDHVGFYLLDVSGHGVRAALLSVTLSRIMTPLSDQPSLLLKRDRDNGRLVPAPPAAVAEELNSRFQLDLDTWQYFTLFYGVLNTKTFELRFISCGQPGPIYIPFDDAPRNLHKPVLAVGWVPDPHYCERSLALRPGDRLQLYSDGVAEAKNTDRAMFGDDRVIKTVEQYRNLPLRQSVEAVLSAAEKFSGQPFDDDVSALAVEIAPTARLARIPEKVASLTEQISEAAAVSS